jgi:hypothetical protein
MKLSDLASALECELRGAGDIKITGVAGMEQASATELTFLANPKYAHKLKHTQAAAGAGGRADGASRHPATSFEKPVPGFRAGAGACSINLRDRCRDSTRWPRSTLRRASHGSPTSGPLR